jgi:hypothetical protein
MRSGPCFSLRSPVVARASKKKSGAKRAPGRASDDRKGRLFPFPHDQALLLAGLSLVAVLGALEAYTWLGALINELGFHIVLLSVLAALVAGARRAWLSLAGLLLLAGYFAWPLMPLYRTTKPTPQAGPLLRVASAHLAGQPLDAAALTAWLERERPDAAALTGLASDMDVGTHLGPYRVARGNAELRALLLVQSALVVPLRERPGEHPTLTLRAGRCQARTIAIELPPLSAYTALDARRRAIERVTRLRSTPRSIWLGHLGSRAEALDLAAFTKVHALRDARLGHGRLASAPGSLGPLGFPLSHALVHGWISVRDVSIKPPIVAGAQRTLSGVIELTEARCRFAPDQPLE